MRSLLFWGLLPFVVPQALLLRKNAPRFAGAEGAKQGSVGQGRPYRLLAIGDSIIAGVGAASMKSALVGQAASHLASKLDANILWTASGKIGADSAGILNQLVPNLEPTEQDFILLSAGVNDVTSLTRVSAWKRNLRQLIEALRAHSPNAIIAVAGIPPLRIFPLLPQPLRSLFGVRADNFDQVAHQVIQNMPAVTYLTLEFEAGPGKFALDGFHPSEDSYQELGLVAAEGFVEALNCRYSHVLDKLTTD
jgi:lysophospholipase L1-like esterase